MDDSDARVARNQTVFRAGNEAIRSNAGEPDALLLLCECGDSECFERIAVKPDEYGTVRASPRLFVLAVGHETRSTSESVVVDETERFVIAEKLGVSGQIAEELPPGSTGRGPA